MKWLIAALLLADSISAAGLPVVPLRKGLVITSSVTISRESYFLTADTSLEMPLIIIRGKHLTVDFNNCILQGSADKKFPNEFFGLAVLVEKGSSNIIIKNANIHGFKIAIMADSVEGLQIESCDLSYNYRQHLHSNWEREDISDWMSYHHNEQDEWMRYGAGIYLKDCDHAIIKNNFISGGQCGLMMMRCDSNEIYNNNFSFNSGIGIGMYRSSFNKIYANVLDFNVRGYSDGIYNRGQDSAGILMFEQSSNNEIGYNSVTHGGDGFFLWAGEHTMNTGKGGCNDNFIHENNFSYAPTNGVEVTFSRNTIKNNIIEECDNGVWGGYSFETEILANAFANNKTAIAIEQGQNNSIITNLFQKNNTAIKLWSRPSQPADWGYARSKDVSSKNYKMLSNTFIENGTAFEIMGTDSLLLEDNTVNKTRIVYKIGARTKRLDTGRIFLDDTTLTVTLEDLKKFFSNRIPKTNVFEGRNQIRITEWGPYDFRYPLLWLKNVDS
ncbi:MAG TPA: right-handed parallel beta-helix repeat-containing protein, partial [Parafilimonas sp.]|nr:right-handed parallel beta-helix repeat-containing protein [Parafilimonas sp.]